MDAVQPQGQQGQVVAQAAQAAADETLEAIDEAAKINEDPQVERALEDAALKADKTSSRVGWLRGFIDRILGQRTA